MSGEGIPITDPAIETQMPPESPSSFDPLPQVRIERGEADQIAEIFDGSYREWGIAVDLDPKGNVLHAKNMNLVTGETRVYEPDGEGGWRSYRGRLNSDPRLVAKLDAITADLRRQMAEWRRNNPGTPIRHWSRDFVRRGQATLAGKAHLTPQEWTDQHALTQAEIKHEIELRRSLKQEGNLEPGEVKIFPNKSAN